MELNGQMQQPSVINAGPDQMDLTILWDARDEIAEAVPEMFVSSLQ